MGTTMVTHTLLFACTSENANKTDDILFCPTIYILYDIYYKHLLDTRNPPKTPFHKKSLATKQNC